ncbi:hypothetical protein KP014_28315 [Paenibacillus sophorae]|uniref:Uncharacterized protein n=1 Tax=Paenibacillus sophorae TaxID=1333845 RepID=A0ABX8HBQ5_9BACL|nr:hypothetical protein [Paenibacillus sophorae]QWU15675.1 hypothetical protein KP014_28315 [Paenibacillus sophorae]
MSGADDIKDVAATLSMMTNTPIPYYLGLPLAEMVDWAERVAKLRKRRG